MSDLPKLKRRGLLAGLLLAPFAVRAEETVLAPEQFVAQAFGGETPTQAVIWLDEPRQQQLREIFGHGYPRARLHYWRSGTRSAWILDEIGKEFPITAGFVVDGDHVDSASLLVYRESRGGEIRLPSFLRQFRGQRLDARHGLAPNVDGISGATLSVDAMRRMARAALVLAQAAASG